MAFTAYQFPDYVVVTDQAVDEPLAAWGVPDLVAAEIIENGAAFEVIDGDLVVNGEVI